MKRKIALFLILIIMLGFFVSCNTWNVPKSGDSEVTPPAKRITQLDKTDEPIYSLPQAPLTEPVPLPNLELVPPSPTPPPIPSPPPPVQEKKPIGPKPLGSYQTPLLNRSKHRIENINLAIRKINDYRLDPGDIFSFNDIVGKRDATNGFKMAAVIVNGEYSEDMGGGVCQLSSTIFNAADKAGMEIIERHSHSREVKYVPKGRDAAVSYGYLDLKFKNTKDYSVKINARIEDRKLKIYLYKVK